LLADYSTLHRKNQVNPVEVKLERIVRQALDAVIIPGNIDVDVDLKSLTHHAMLDSEQIIQALTNLIKNAVEAMSEGGKLDISIIDKNGNVEFHISIPVQV
jgi:signal transduction histidine kinase